MNTSHDPPAISLAVTRTLSETVRGEIIALCNEAFPEPFDTLFDYIPPDGLHILARTGNGLLAGHAVITHRALRVNGGAPLRTAYFDAVATRPSMRNNGIGSLVMQTAVEAVQNTHDLAALGTNIQSWYGRLGWEIWHGELFLVKDDERIPTPDHRGHVMIHRLQRTPDIDPDDALSASWRPLDGW